MDGGNGCSAGGRIGIGIELWPASKMGEMASEDCDEGDGGVAARVGSPISASLTAAPNTGALAACA
eukprot:scaffold191869_cov29-Tisochrysis_lutea.AAC.6